LPVTSGSSTSRSTNSPARRRRGRAGPSKSLGVPPRRSSSEPRKPRVQTRCSDSEGCRPIDDRIPEIGNARYRAIIERRYEVKKAGNELASTEIMIPLVGTVLRRKLYILKKRT